MPMYEYVCSVCGKVTNIECKMADMKQAVNCKNCGHVAYKILPTKVSSVVKGNCGKKGYYNSHWKG